VSGRERQHIAPGRQRLTPLSTQVNVLSPIFLALLLMPLLRRTAGQVASIAQPLLSPRIIFTGSAIAEMAPTKFFDVENPLLGLDDERRYKPSTRYDESKVSSGVVGNIGVCIVCV
jgi:hypothetical protein